MPDANKDQTINQVEYCEILPNKNWSSSFQIVAAGFGAAGQRCMALTTIILVGEARAWLKDIVEKAKGLKVDAGIETRIA